MKIFLSHSSKDKDVVERVYNEIGAGLCHYDVATFDPVSFVPEQIYDALSNSSHFVFFASDSAIKSGWVQGELKIAFLNWMRNEIKDVMVFLLGDIERNRIPDWLQSYVMIEQPSPVHIAARIKSKIADFEKKNGMVMPFYRWDDLQKLEKSIVVQTNKMPKAIMVCSPDGYGRKHLINELFSRNFHGVALNKLSLFLEDCASEVNLYKNILGLTSLTSLQELSKKIRKFEEAQQEERMEILSEKIDVLCGGNQVLILEAYDVFFDDTGGIADWVVKLIKSLKRSGYPKLIFISARRPAYNHVSIVNDLALITLEPLSKEKSEVLFSWWINRFELNIAEGVVNKVLGYVEGNVKQIELAALLFNDVPDYRKVEKRIFSDLEGQANEVLKIIDKNNLSKIILAFVAFCGHVSESDLIFAFSKAKDFDQENIEKTIYCLIGYGFILSDSISLRVPAFLVRPSQKKSKIPEVNKVIAEIWEGYVEHLNNISDYSNSSVAFLTDASIAHLKSGKNENKLIDSIVLPSECYKMARRYYDEQNYKKSLELCEMAYARRLALTDDGSIEILRIHGLCAARLNSESTFKTAVKELDNYSNIKAKRIKNFLLGFNYRLDGDFDSGLEKMVVAYQSGGGNDFHILRELAFLSFAQDNLTEARRYIRKAKQHARLNPFIIEMELRIEYAQGEEHVMSHQREILELIEDLSLSEYENNGKFSYQAKIGYYLAIGKVDDANELIKSMKNKSQSILILEAKVLMEKKKYLEAKNILLNVKSDIEKGNGSQRKSVLPIVSRLIIDATFGISIIEVIEEYKRNQSYLPRKIREKIQADLRDAVVYNRVSINSRQKKILGFESM